MKTIYEIYDYIGGDYGFSFETLYNKFMAQLPEKPKKPTEPSLKTVKPTTEDIEKYQSLLKDYEKLNAEYPKALEAWKIIDMDMYNQVVVFIKDKTGFNNIPEKSKQKVWEYVNENSRGYEALFFKLSEIVELF